jgi:hypothetical protein
MGLCAIAFFGHTRLSCHIAPQQHEARDLVAGIRNRNDAALDRLLASLLADEQRWRCQVTVTPSRSIA